MRRAGYCIFSYQVLASLVALVVHGWLQRQSLTVDFMLVFEEVVTILLVIVGSCYELPADLILVSASLYAFNSSRRLSLEHLA